MKYDNWFSERSLYEDGTYEKAMALLRERDYIAQREGASGSQLRAWVAIRTPTRGPQRDNVLVRSTGAPTYFASDIAYHYDKLRRARLRPRRSTSGARTTRATCRA